MQTNSLLVAALACAAGALCPHASAGYTATSRTSSLTRTAWQNGQPNTTTTLGSTTAPTPFSITVGTPDSQGSGAQTSSLSTLGASYSGRTSSWASQTSGIYTSSRFDLRFTVTTATPFHLDGSLTSVFSPTATLTLTGTSSGTNANYIATGDNVPPFPARAVRWTGTLNPGNYRLLIEELGTKSGQPIGSGTTCSFTFSLASCAGDLNSDAQVDDADFALFAAAYDTLDCADPAMAAGCPADINRDAFVDDVDFVLFAIAYDDLLCP